MTRKLTPKQEKFAREVASGKSYSDAYRAAYNTSRMKPATVKNNAYKLMQRNDITATVEKYKEQIDRCVIEQAAWTKVDANQKLKWLIDMCVEAISLEYPTSGRIDNSARKGLTDAIAELNKINRVDTQGDTDSDITIVFDVDDES